MQHFGFTNTKTVAHQITTGEKRVGGKEEKRYCIQSLHIVKEKII